MDSHFTLPIVIRYRPPSWLAGLLGFSHTGAIICIFTATVPIWLKCVLAATVAGGLCYSFSIWHRDTWCRDPAGYLLDSHDQWWLIDAGKTRRVWLLPGALVHPVLVVLRFRDGLAVRNLILSANNTDPRVLRRLRVRLRFKQG